MTYREFMMMPLCTQLDYLDENYILDEEAVQQFRYFAHVFDIKHGMVVHNQFAKSFIDMQVQPYNLPSGSAYIIYQGPFSVSEPKYVQDLENIPRVVELIVGKEAFYLYYAKEVENATDMGRQISIAIGYDRTCTRDTIDAIKAIYDKYPEAHMTKEQMQHA